VGCLGLHISPKDHCVADIFFSYTRPDRDRVEPLIRALEAQGWTVWWDPEIQWGGTFDEVIEAELTKAHCVIVAWSKVSTASKWVKEEARTANEAGKLVPILLDAIKPPFGFRDIQAGDLSGWNNNRDAPAFLRLCSTVRAKLPATTPQPPGPTPTVADSVPDDRGKKASEPPVPPSSPPPSRDRRRLILGALASVVIAAVPGLYFYGGGFFGGAGPAPDRSVNNTPNNYQVSVHTARPASEIALVTKALTDAGYTIGGQDPNVDQSDGSSPRSGVDYAPDAGKKNQAAAEQTAAIVNKTLGTDLKARPQSNMSPNRLGVWLPSRGDYKVVIRFAVLNRERDIAPLSRKLRDIGWNAQDPQPSGSNIDRTAEAETLREVRYSGPGDRPAADMLAKDLLTTGIGSVPLVVKLDSSLPLRNLQVWIGPYGFPSK
jgi:hypothetical protein